MPLWEYVKRKRIRATLVALQIGSTPSTFAASSTSDGQRVATGAFERSLGRTSIVRCSGKPVAD